MSVQDIAHGSSYNENESLSVPGRRDVEVKGSDSMYDFVCDPCEEEGHRYVPFGFCSDCNHFLCEKCYSVHCRPLPTRNHKLLDKDKVPKSRPQVSVNHQDIDEKCEQHHGKVVEYFCENHGTIGCSVCITLDHKSCDGVKFVPDMKVDKDKVHEVMRELSSLTNNVKEKQNRMKQILALDKQSFDIAVEDARIFCRKTKAFVDMIETKFEETAERERDDLVKTKSLQIDDLEKTIQQTESLSKDMSCYQLANREANLFIAMKKAEQVIASTSCDDHEVLTSSFTFVPNEDLGKFQDNVHILGSIHVKSKHTEKADEANSTERVVEQDTSDLSTITIKRTFSKFDANAKDDKFLCVIVGIVSLYDPVRDVIADAGNNKIKVVKWYSNILTTSLNLPSRPFAMAKLNGNCVCVTMPERKEILVISISKLFMKDMISKAKSISCGGKCYGIAINEVHGEIVVACEYDVGKFAIDILDFDGRKLKHFKCREDNEEPRYIQVTDEHIYTLDINTGVLKKRRRVDGMVEIVFTVEQAFHFTVLKHCLIVVTGTTQSLRGFDHNFHELKVKGQLCDNNGSIVHVQNQLGDSLYVGFRAGYINQYTI